MKNKVFILFLSFTLILSSIFMVYAEPGKGKGQEKGDKSNTIYKSISLLLVGSALAYDPKSIALSTG